VHSQCEPSPSVPSGPSIATASRCYLVWQTDNGGEFKWTFPKLSAIASICASHRPTPIRATWVPLDLDFEALLRHLAGFVQPGCPVKVFSVPSCHLDQLHGFAPAHFP